MDYKLKSGQYTVEEAYKEICDYILGKDWYCVDPLPAKQVRYLQVEAIKREFDKRKWSFWDRLKEALRG